MKKIINKKASILDLFLWMAIGIVTIIFFAGWIYGFNKITTTFSGMDKVIFKDSDDYQTISNISDVTFGKIENVQKDSLHILAFVMLFFMGISIPITYFIQKAHPIFFLAYLFILIGAFISSVYISNQYELLMSNDVLGATISEFTGASFIMLNLPIWVSILGILGAILLFAGILRDAGAGDSMI